MSNLDSMIETAISDKEAEETVEAPVEEVVTEEAPAEAAEQTAEEFKIEEAIEGLSPPDKWSGFSKTKFNMLPKDVQQELLNQHKHVTDFQKSVEDKGKVYNALDASLGEYKQAAIATYGSLEGMFNHYFQLDQWAAKDPQGLVKWFLQQRGIDPQTLFGQQQPAEGQQPPDPLMKELSELRQTVQKLQESNNPLVSEAQKQIDEFSKNPAYPYFNDLRADMKLLIDSGQVSNLPDAYQKAMLMNDKTRSVYIDEELKKKTELKTQEAKKSKGAATIKGANGTVSKKPGTIPLDDIIAQSMGGDRL